MANLALQKCILFFGWAHINGRTGCACAQNVGSRLVQEVVEFIGVIEKHLELVPSVNKRADDNLSPISLVRLLLRK